MTLENEIREHENRLKERDRHNQAVLDALAAGRTPPPPPKPKFRPESFFEPKKFKPKPKDSRVALPARELADEIPKDVTNAGELVLHFLNEHDKAPSEDPADVETSEKEDE